MCVTIFPPLLKCHFLFEWLLLLSEVLSVYRATLFNLGTAEHRGTAHSLLHSVRFLKLVLFRVIRFCQTLNNVSKVPRLNKSLKNTALQSAFMDLGKLNLVMVVYFLGSSQFLPLTMKC